MQSIIQISQDHNEAVGDPSNWNSVIIRNRSLFMYFYTINPALRPRFVREPGSRDTRARRGRSETDEYRRRYLFAGDESRLPRAERDLSSRVLRVICRAEKEFRLRGIWESHAALGKRIASKEFGFQVFGLLERMDCILWRIVLFVWAESQSATSSRSIANVIQPCHFCSSNGVPIIHAV